MSARPKRYVTGPDGLPLTLVDLPAMPVKRWTPIRKLCVIFAVRGGLISMQQALGMYQITAEEFLRWCQLHDRHGPGGVRSNYIHQYRPRIPRNPR